MCTLIASLLSEAKWFKTFFGTKPCNFSMNDESEWRRQKKRLLWQEVSLDVVFMNRWKTQPDSNAARETCWNSAAQEQSSREQISGLIPELQRPTFFSRFLLKLRENHQIPQTNTALSMNSGFQKQEEEKIGVKANLKLIKNWISVIRGVLSIILAASEERGCQASSSLPPLTVFLFVAEPERCIWISKFVFPRKLSRVTFTEKRKRYFSEKKNKINK